MYGTTSKISGGFSVLYADPAAATMGPIEIEADSFKGEGRFARSLRDSNINLLILHTDMDTGHGGASGRYKRYKEIAREYAFLLDLAQQ